ncbi:MAG: hypothetical protein V4489_06420 [Chlamydiota bacterium]
MGPLKRIFKDLLPKVVRSLPTANPRIDIQESAFKSPAGNRLANTSTKTNILQSSRPLSSKPGKEEFPEFGNLNKITTVKNKSLYGLPTQAPLSTMSEEGLQPLPSAKKKLENILTYLNSPGIVKASEKSLAFKIIRCRLLTSLFHLNFEPEIVEKNKPTYSFIKSTYPYDPVYKEPFPKIPSLEAIEEAIRFATHIAENSEILFDQADVNNQNVAVNKLIEDLTTYSPYKLFTTQLSSHTFGPDHAPKEITKNRMIKEPVDSYFSLRQRLKEYGETASFPEFTHAVSESLKDLHSDEIEKLARKDPIFKNEVDDAIAELEKVMQNKGEAIALQAAFNAPYPYKRTLKALERAVEVFDLKERIKYPESNNWHEVEESWYPEKGEKHPKILPLYHFNRYKYQQFGLLSNSDVVLIPWHGDATAEDLIRLRPVPIGMIGVIPNTIRADRHHNTPLDFWYHDINHIRRMWGYDKQIIQAKQLNSFETLQNDMKTRQSFLEDLLKKTDPNALGLTEEHKQVRQLERFIIFETFHETALSGTKESLLNDLTRGPATHQPFEVQVQGTEYFKELNRRFDGNLKSGADALEMSFSKPTKIQYFFDRAPGFLNNIYNKLAFGFYDSVFEERNIEENSKYRTPEYLAQAAINIFRYLKCPEEQIPPMSVLIDGINDRSGQPELYNYFALRKEDDQSAVGKSLIEKIDNANLIRPEIRDARALKMEHPEMTPVEIAQKVMISKDNKEIITWMLASLESYDEHFDQFFDAKLKKTEPHKFTDSHDYINRFIGNEKGKLLITQPSTDELKALETGGTLYTDTWAVPFFNTATQTKEEARAGVKNALNTFKGTDLTADISMHRFINLMALYARPEFDDVARCKIQIFPSESNLKKYGKERNDAKTVGDHFPDEAFIINTKEPSLDDLSFTFGLKIHFVQIISHSETIGADNRLFVGARDFLEHNFSHGYFSLELPIPGDPEDWTKIHEEFRLMQAKIPNTKQRLMNSLVYFHLTHESGYKQMIPDARGNPPKPDAYKKELAVIKERIETANDFDWIKKTENIGEDYGPLLEKSFETVTIFFKKHLDDIQRNLARDEGKS